MKTSQQEVMQEEIEAIKNAEKQTQSKRISRKLRVLPLRFSGKTVHETATIMEMPTSQIYGAVNANHVLALFIKDVTLDAEQPLTKFEGENQQEKTNCPSPGMCTGKRAFIKCRKQKIPACYPR